MLGRRAHLSSAGRRSTGRHSGKPNRQRSAQRIDSRGQVRYNGAANRDQQRGGQRYFTLRIYDVSVPISDLLPVWPGDPRIEIEPFSRISDGQSANVTRLSMSSHTGTHVDAPYHFVEGGTTVDRLSLDLLMGPAFVAEMDGLEGNKIEVYDLASLRLPRSTTRLLLKTSNSSLWEGRLGEFERSYVHLTPQAAEWLVNRGIRLIGVDYLSVEAFDVSDHRVHRTLLEAGTVIIEGLNLSQVPPGPCRLICLPLKIAGGDGAPARVLVIRD